ncbi:hypothetical protein Dvina_38400 [Dactylosporangium vinaceum]|uniref:Uncharacterized protein n=1 Tax=Dactylosporangium vinaceum TaxID=53362 RepID=A0ABV5ML22_9ACTN|nr:hypothetical protein [Dactylosporangium vinaceum]UAB94021.1 hypothetical protein Dvina_38400 [Dactylosporangium vinaceum]
MDGRGSGRDRSGGEGADPVEAGVERLVAVVDDEQATTRRRPASSRSANGSSTRYTSAS